MMSNTFSESARTDMATLLPIMLLIVILGLGYLLQSWKATCTRHTERAHEPTRARHAWRLSNA